MPAELAVGYIIMAAVNTAAGFVNGGLTRKQQGVLAEKNQQEAVKIEKNRQDFNLRMHLENVASQKELCNKNHEFRIKEQYNNFVLRQKETEWNKFINEWPLVTLPLVMRQEQTGLVECAINNRENQDFPLDLEAASIPLRVIFARNSDRVFNDYVYPHLESGLREFVSCYNNKFNSKDIIFYHNGFKASIAGDAINENIYYALKDIPIIIIDTNVLFDKVEVYLTMWGLCSVSGRSQMKVFSIPYQPRFVDNRIDLNYYKNIISQVLTSLKFILGYSYDVYNLVQYNKPPILHKIAQFELDSKVENAMLSNPEIKEIIGQKYIEIYDEVMGKNFIEKKTLLPLPVNKCTLPYSRLEFAEATKNCISQNEYVNMLDDSLKAWVELRTDLPVDIFLKSFLADASYFEKYISDSDLVYLKKLKQLYPNNETLQYYRLLSQLIDISVHCQNTVFVNPNKTLVNTASKERKNRFKNL